MGKKAGWTKKSQVVTDENPNPSYEILVGTEVFKYNTLPEAMSNYSEIINDLPPDDRAVLIEITKKVIRNEAGKWDIEKEDREIKI